MARTPLARTLRRIADSVADDSPDPEASHARLSRRRLLAGTAGLAASSVVPAGAWSAAAAAPTPGASPRVVVVGAGLAGLSAAHRLRAAGITSTVVEADQRIGGRCWSSTTSFEAGQVIEHGGELIDTGHIAIRQLVKELGLRTENLLAAEQQGTEPVYFFDGAPYTYAEATADIKTIWQQLHSDVSAASYPTLYNLSTERGRELDRMSITDWISAYVPGGLTSRLGQLLDVAYTIEYGGDSSTQSSLNMLYLIAYSGQGQLNIFGPSDEKFHVVGGNDQIATRLADRLPGQIRLGTALTALALNADGTWTVTTKSGNKTSSQVADHVILTLPFSLLRSVDLSRAAFPPLKMTAISELPMGTNSKLALQFTDRHWRTLGFNGDTYADTGYQATWEVTRGQPGTQGILVDYTGGTVGAGFGAGSTASYANRFLAQIEPLYPGLTNRWNGRAILDFWAAYPWTLGSYSFWKVGQYTRFSGVEKEAVGTCHFAGEHTSQDFQGYLNGAVETGYRAAAEVLATLK
ncbi:FAD-dependent oxidoreductase [Nocardioides sp.]|uniref:flavin monoamine oxidase family protein n=1 Tax=Nocardioides sp. TaxID=35761 RepID=UPI00286E2C23|nr:FAD-dependent oxidoreductase [Nocardioides sp.]